MSADTRLRLFMASRQGAELTRYLAPTEVDKAMRNCRCAGAELRDASGRKVGGVEYIGGKWHWWYEPECTQ